MTQHPLRCTATWRPKSEHQTQTLFFAFSHQRDGLSLCRVYRSGGWSLLLSREYGHMTTLASQVSPSTPRTGLTDVLYQAIKEINSEGGEVLMRVRPRRPTSWMDVGPCAGMLCATDDAVAAAIERFLYEGTSPVRMADECAPGVTCAQVLLGSSGSSTIGIVRNVTEARRLYTNDIAAFNADPRWSCTTFPTDLLLEGQCNNLRVFGVNDTYVAQCPPFFLTLE